MCSSVSKMSSKELEDLLQNTEKLLNNKAMVQKLPDKGEKLLNSRQKLLSELQFRKDMDHTTMNMRDLFLSHKSGRDPETHKHYALKRAEILDKLSTNKSPDRKHAIPLIKNLTCTESLELLTDKEGLSTPVFKEISVLNKIEVGSELNKLVNYREGRPDSDDDDGSESEKDYGDSDSNTSSSAANDSDGEHD